jgi:hypothetical protein
VRDFLFFGYSLRLRKPKQKASTNGRVKNHRRPLFHVYKGPGEIHPKLRPNPPRNSNSKVKRSFCSSNGSRTRNRRPVNRPSRRITPWQGKRHLRQVKRAPFHLRQDDRVKKGAPHYLNLYPFPFLLSLSCHKDRERGYFEKDPSQRRKWAPSPPTDQGFEGCALRGSATAPKHSDSEPITDQGFEGWPLGRVREPPQSTQSQG